MTYEQWVELTKLPFKDANARMSSEPKHEEYKARFTGRTNPNQGWFMHPSDHHDALQTLLKREPTWAEVWGSLFSSASIDAAWDKTAFAPDGAPNDWPPSDGTESREYMRLVTALRPGRSYSTATQIADGKRRDPHPAKTAENIRKWDEIASKRAGWKQGTKPGAATTTEPTPTPTPKPEPTTPPSRTIMVKVTIAPNGTATAEVVK